MEMEAPGFWDDPDRSNKQMKVLKNLKDTVGEYRKLETQYEDILTLIEMGYEENDEDLVAEIRGELDEFISELEKIGMTVLSASQYTEQGYVKYLEELVEIETKDGEKFPMQAIISTAFIVAAK